MGLRQDDRADRRRLNRKLLPVKLAQVLEPLEQPAVDKDAVARRAMSKSASVSLCGFLGQGRSGCRPISTGSNHGVVGEVARDPDVLPV